MPCLYRITPPPRIDIDFGAGPYFFYYSLCINYLLCNDFFNYHYYYYLWFALFFVHKKMIRVGQYRRLSVLTYHVTSAGRGASSTLHYPMPGTSASPCRLALTVLCHHFGVPSSLLRHLGTGLGDGTFPASSSGGVINTEHINQLRCLHAQSFKFLTCVRLGQALYFFGKKLLVKISLSKLCL